MKLSPTRLKDYERCPRLYRYRHLDGLRQRFEPPTPELVVGESVHLALARFFRLPPAHRDLQVLVGLLRSAWSLNGARAAAFRGDRETERTHGLAALGMLETFYASHDVSAVPVAVEAVLKRELAGGLVLWGRLDRVDRLPDGRCEVIDYKTGKAPPAAAMVQDDLQVLAYGLLVEASLPLPLQGVTLVYLRGDRVITVPADPERLRQAEARILGLAEAIRSDVEFAPNPGPYCERCPYRSICPAGGSSEAGGPSEAG